MKIVLNKCYGGFGLSCEALILAIERECSFIQKLPSDKFWKNAVVHDHDNPDTIQDGYKFYWTGVIEKDEYIYILEYGNEHRTNPGLIQIVEELGERANGLYSELKVVEIPDDVKWEICEYDGVEWIAEQHRKWS